jgi:hypothetical protein
MKGYQREPTTMSYLLSRFDRQKPWPRRTYRSEYGMKIALRVVVLHFGLPCFERAPPARRRRETARILKASVVFAGVVTGSAR